LHSMVEMMRGGDFGGADGSVSVGGAGYAIAAGVGTGILWSLAGSLLSLVYLLGLNLVYLRVTEGLDVDSTEAVMKSGLDEAKRQAADLGQKARDAADRVREPSRPSGGSQPVAPTFSERSPESRPDIAAQGAAPWAQPPSPPVPSSPVATSFCPQCQSPVDKKDVFCGLCGHRLK
jgi:hypothetical protein